MQSDPSRTLDDPVTWPPGTVTLEGMCHLSI